MKRSSDSHADFDAHAGAIARMGLTGRLFILVCLGGFGAWATLANISGAVVASGQLVIDGNAKRVQHAVGGIVAELRVREGDMVRAGDLLVRLDDTQARTAFEIHSRQIDETLARIARLEAERDGASSISFPAALIARSGDREIRAVMATEERLMQARASARAGTRAQLARRVEQLQAEKTGATDQRAGRTREHALVTRELEGVRQLHQRSIAPLTRVNALERDTINLEAQRAALKAQADQADSRIAEIQLQIAQIEDELRAEAMRDLRDAQARLAESLQRRAVADDQLRRIDLRAPVDGQVHQLVAHTVGGVINPAEQVMLIVPAQTNLMIEARIAPPDYDQVFLDQPTTVRLHAFNQRQTPELTGRVARLAPDVVRDPATGASWYVVRIAIPADQAQRLAPLELRAGMTADAFLRTGDRSPASYLLRPLYDQIARAFRER
jgi:HlyD family secretion protein